MTEIFVYGPTSFSWPCLPRGAFGPPSNVVSESGVPSTALLAEDGSPLLTEAGDYLVTEA